MTNTEKLRAVMAEHKLSADQVATILKRKPSTVRVWRCKHPARQITDRELRLLELELASRMESVK